MNVAQLIKNLERYPMDSVVGIKCGLGSSFKTVTHISSNKAHIVHNDEIIGETILINIHNQDEE